MELDALRLAAVVALLNGGSPPWPTLAGKYVFDSLIDTISDVVPIRRKPVIVVRTDEDFELHDRGGTETGRQARLLIELSMVTAVEDPNNPGHRKLDWPQTDAALELQLGTMCWQVYNALRGFGRWAQWFKDECKYSQILAWNSMPRFSGSAGGAGGSGTNLRLAARTIEAVFKIRDECIVQPLNELAPESPPFLPPSLLRVVNTVLLKSSKDSDLYKSFVGLRDQLERYAQAERPRMPALLTVYGTVPVGTDPSGDASVQAAWEIDQGGWFIEEGSRHFDPQVPPDPRLPWVERKLNAIDDRVTDPYPKLSDIYGRGYLFYSTAALAKNVDVTNANAYLLRYYVMMNGTLDGVNPLIQNLSLSALFRPYGLFNANADPQFFPDRLTSEAETHLLEQMWLYAKHWSTVAEPTTLSVWSIVRSENQWLQRVLFLLLSAQTFKNLSDYQTRTYDDGHTAAEHYASWQVFVNELLRERIKKGAMLEVHSPGYSKYSYAPLFDLYDFAEDPLIRTKAGLLLDILYIDWSEAQKNYVHGGAKSRVYPDNEMTLGRTDEMILGRLYELNLATSLYNPPDLAGTIALGTPTNDYDKTSRRPGIGPVVTTVGSPTGERFNPLDPAQSVVDYAFVSRNYIISSARLDPSKQTSPGSAQNRWCGIIVKGDNDARVFPQVGYGPITEDPTNDNFLCIQNKNVLVMQRKDDYRRSAPRLAAQPTLIYFAQALDFVEEHVNWIFVHEGPVYIAVGIVNGTYSWLTAQKKEWTPYELKSFIRLSNPKSPIIMIVNEASDYANFNYFKRNIMHAPLTYVPKTDNNAISPARIEFSGIKLFLSEAGPTGIYSIVTTPGTIDGSAIDFAPARLLDSPFMRSDFDSGIVRARFGNDALLIDVTDPNNPHESNGPVSGMPNPELFPPGDGDLAPIVFPDVP